MPPVRQPIVAVLGHVDHGKTSLLDRIRGSRVANKEAGGITQHIGATEVPLGEVAELCGPLMAGKAFDVPGLLFIDTPGHRAFTSLRTRGGALADLAVLVVDINEGLKPQTVESIRILRQHKTPFVIAANKVDRLEGFNTEDEPNKPFALHAKQLQAQGADISQFERRYWELLGKLSEEGLPAERYDHLKDFRRAIAVVPCSAHTGLGLPDLLLILTGLAERFLKEQLEWDPDGPAQATILEVKEVQGLGPCADIILHDGTLHVGDSIIVGGQTEPVETTVRALLRPREMSEIRTTAQQRFDKLSSVHAAAGLRIAAPGLEDAMAGSALVSLLHEDDRDDALARIRAEQEVQVPLDDEGVLIKADTIGSLEALAFELRDAEIPMFRARVGNVSRRDVMEAANLAAEHRCILAFNVSISADAEEEARLQDVTIRSDEIIYRLIEEYTDFRSSSRKAEEASQRKDMVFPGKLLFMEDHIFRQNKPAIIGMRILAGRIRVGHRLVRDDGKVVGRVRSLRLGEQAVPEAKQGDEVAVAIEGGTVGRQLRPGGIMYVDIPESDFRGLKDARLTQDEREIMTELQLVKRSPENPFWGL